MKAMQLLETVNSENTNEIPANYEDIRSIDLNDIEGMPTNSIVAYLSRIGETPLLTREQEQVLAIAIEEGNYETFLALVKIPFCRDHLLEFPNRLTSGEVSLTDISTLEESSHEDWTPSLTAELNDFSA